MVEGKEEERGLKEKEIENGELRARRRCSPNHNSTISRLFVLASKGSKLGPLFHLSEAALELEKELKHGRKGRTMPEKGGGSR